MESLQSISESTQASPSVSMGTIALLTMAMLSMCTLNINGIHDPMKWKDLLNLLPCTDIICLQETHLTSVQEYSFKLHAQSYNWYFSHGSSNSAGVVVAVHRHNGANVTIVGSIPGRLITLDIICHCSFHLVNIYAISFRISLHMWGITCFC